MSDLTRTVIRFDRAGKSVTIALDRAPITFEPDSYRVDLAKVTGSTLVERGTALTKLLSKREPIKSVLKSTLASTANAEPSPIYFHVRAGSADAIPWEQIYTPQSGFCALDARWPVGRIARTVRTVRRRALEPPFRMVAVLSAAGVQGQRQLQALLAAKEKTTGIRLRVITGDETVLALAKGKGVDGVLIKGTGPELCQQIAEARPHLLHVLCHGRVVGGVRMLNFGAISDFPGQAGQDQPAFGKINVAVQDMARALATCDPWLVVLAACKSADAEGSDGPAFAHHLVEEGVTAVIGMRRIADITVTDRFCKALYPEVLARVRAATTPAPAGEQDRERIIDWAGALTTPRQVLRDDSNAAEDETWADPVLYAQIDDLWVQAPSQDITPAAYAELQGRLDQYRDTLVTLDRTDADPAAVAEVQALIADAEAVLSQDRT